MKMKDFYSGPVYISTWIKEAIDASLENPMEIGGNKMLSKKEDSYLVECTCSDCKQLNIGKKKKFTIVEGIKLFEIMNSNHTDNLNKASFWSNIQNNRLLPERTAEQMKKFWTKNEHRTVEQWLVKAIHENYDFSLSVKHIPSPNFVDIFRKKYEIEFMRLETMDPLSTERYVDKTNGAGSSAHSSVYS